MTALEQLANDYAAQRNPAEDICRFLLRHSNNSEYLAENLALILGAIQRDVIAEQRRRGKAITAAIAEDKGR